MVIIITFLKPKNTEKLEIIHQNLIAGISDDKAIVIYIFSLYID